MMIKFLAHGTGKASSAATYLLDSHDHKGGVVSENGKNSTLRRATAFT